MTDIDSLHYAFRDRLPMWVIYRPNTRDHPGHWVIRMHLSLPVPTATEHFMLSPTLARARLMLPDGLHRLDRDTNDDATIEEVWL